MLAPRATRVPASEDRSPPPEPDAADAAGAKDGNTEEDGEAPDRPMGEVVLSAARAAIRTAPTAEGVAEQLRHPPWWLLAREWPVKLR